jgi:hypothetical protein
MEWNGEWNAQSPRVIAPFIYNGVRSTWEMYIYTHDPMYYIVHHVYYITCHTCIQHAPQDIVMYRRMPSAWHQMHVVKPILLYLMQCGAHNSV